MCRSNKSCASNGFLLSICKVFNIMQAGLLRVFFESLFMHYLDKNISDFEKLCHKINQEKCFIKKSQTNTSDNVYVTKTS